LRADIEVEMSFDGALWPVDLDPGELELAILNICVNARDAMPDGGTIRISAHNSRDPQPLQRAETVTLAITDTGVGMSPEVAARVFEPFYTTKEVGKGSGLGLAQVYGFVTQSNGQVTIESRVGEGTTVTLCFPRSERAVAPAHAAAVEVAPALPRARRRAGSLGNVMLVEDDVTVADLTAEMLKGHGYAVLHAKSAAAALKALSRGHSIDVVFSDVMMPGGMSGVDLAREIRKVHPGLPVVLTTGYIEVARTAMAEGLEVLVKPYSPENVTRVLDAHITKRLSRAQ
jgi:CheY-like chemotaxis protein